MAFEHWAISALVAVANPAVSGLGGGVAAALLCGLAAVGLMIRRVRAAVCVVIVLGITYILSARHLAGTLGVDELTHVPMLAAALYVCWPQLKRADS